MNKPEVYTSVEDTPEGRRWWAEVVVNCGDLDEQVLYASGFHDTDAEARKDARAWLKNHQKGE